MTSIAPIDAKAFRAALGAFATGVTIITTRAPDGTPVGLTANSFNSVSLDPPLILWSLSRNSKSLAAFQSAKEWAVHVLASHQHDLSNRFARAGEDKFQGLDILDAQTSPPLLKDCAARFLCKSVTQHEGGDHIIFIGEVVEFVRTDCQPLIFHSGQYALATPFQTLLSSPRTTELTQDFGEDFLGYLLGRAHFQFHQSIISRATALGLSDEQWFVVATLVAKNNATAEEIDEAYAHHGSSRNTAKLIAELVESEWLVPQIEPDGRTTYRFSDSGREKTLKLLTEVRSLEADIAQRIGVDSLKILKSSLHRYINATNPGIPDLWKRAT